MTDQVLEILKLVLLALLYLFFARVLWAVWSEVRQPAEARGGADRPADPAPVINWRANQRPASPPRGRRGTPARLIVLEPKDRRGTVFALGAEAVTIGRDPANTVVIDDDTYVSSHHATIASSATGVTVDDLASKNGTYLNGSRITRQRSVGIGDRIQVGATVLEAQ